MKKHRTQLDEIADPRRRLDRQCELHVIEQLLNVCETTIVLNAWDRGKALEIHGWVYGLHDGLLQDLSVCVKSVEEFQQVYRKVLDSR